MEYSLRAGHLAVDPPAKRLLIVLTDASPNDEQGWLLFRELWGKYSGDAGIEDAAMEVRQQKQGIRS